MAWAVVKVLAVLNLGVCSLVVKLYMCTENCIAVTKYVGPAYLEDTKGSTNWDLMISVVVVPFVTATTVTQNLYVVSKCTFILCGVCSSIYYRYFIRDEKVEVEE